MAKGLDELLSGDEPEAAPAVEAPEPEKANEPEEGQPRDEHGKFAPKEKGVDEPKEPEAPEPEAEPVPPTADKGLPKDVYEPLRAVRDENRTLKDQLEALNKRLESFQPKQEPPAPPPSLWDDEQGWQSHLEGRVLSQADQLSRINASEMAARSQHADFQEHYDLFNQMALENPAIVKQAMADPHPWNKAYEIARNHKQMRELGATNLDELRAKIREEVLAEAQAQTPAPKPNAPPTLTTERNVGKRDGPAWGGSKSLDELLS